jgi:putative peptidoglycan lipid II flippase
MIITLLSRVLGLFRGTAIAYFFGVSYLTDAYFSAFKISNFFRQLLGEGALGTAFIPLYNEKVSNESEEESKKLIFSIVNLLAIFSTVVTLLMVIFSKEIIELIVSGFPPETKALATHLLKIMSFYFIFISLSGMICAILNNYKQFLIPASTSIFFNLSILGATIYFSKSYGIEALAYGVVFGGFLQLLVVLPSFFKLMKGYSFKIDFRDPYLRRIFLMMGPMLIGIVAKQINTIVDQFFASYLEAGGVSALENATRLYLLPIGVFGISISNVIYPTLSRSMAQGNMKSASSQILKGLNILLFLVIPCTAVFTFYSKDVVKLVFSYGRFNEKDVIITSGALFFYSIGLYFYTAVQLMSRAFYGMKNSSYPVRFSVGAIVINILLNIALIKPLSYKGLALATAISSGVNFILLLFFFRKKFISFSLRDFYIFLFKTAVVTGISLAGSWYIRNIILKLFTFGIIYLALWLPAFYKKRMDVF